ncbi:MAG: YjgP/YjgQ family permease [Bacteroidales bacterium]|nr:YjgP/YjgQ family permease [Bacteroidales bacterium]
MLRIKRLYLFMLQSFVPVLIMTFFICLFIVLMQFLWRYIDDLVGKGLGFGVIGELFFYAALTMVPMALPLAILLASLMTFGNLGERFELTAMKAGGVSLLKTMRPLTILMCFIAVGAFFFQNNVLPVAQTKMWTLLYSMRQKSPEVEIPEGVFYDQIPGVNLYVEHKDQETGTLYDMTIYDISRGFDNARIILADSGRLSVTEAKTHMLLSLYNGEQFENLREGNSNGRSANQPYRRETFSQKDILIAFDNNFNRIDEENMRNQYIGKNISELSATIDSVKMRVDSVGDIYAKTLVETNYLNIPRTRRVYRDTIWVDEPQEPVALAEPIPLDSLFSARSNSIRKSFVNNAIAKIQRVKQDYEFRSYSMNDDKKTIRMHQIEMHKKFTLSFACIIFFFIGAPLGAIIRKGGLGTPLVISVFLFIVYYIIDNSGYKMARDDKMIVWQGIWLSSMVLFPLGIFFTYKAVNDSGVFNFDAYKNFFARLTGRRKRELVLKEIVMDDISDQKAFEMVKEFDGKLDEVSRRLGKNKLVAFVKGHFDPDIRKLRDDMNKIIEYLSNTRDGQVIKTVNMYPFEISASDIAQIRNVNAQLFYLLNKEMTIQGGHEQTNDKNYDTEN